MNETTNESINLEEFKYSYEDKKLAGKEWTNMANKIDQFVNKIICGDSLELIRQIPDKSINLIITSPPYFKQRDYGGFNKEIGNEKTVEEYVDNLLKLFHECVRVIKNDGSIVFNIGDKYEKSKRKVEELQGKILQLVREISRLLGG